MKGETNKLQGGSAYVAIADLTKTHSEGYRLESNDGMRYYVAPTNIFKKNNYKVTGVHKKSHPSEPVPHLSDGMFVFDQKGLKHKLGMVQDRNEEHAQTKDTILTKYQSAIKKLTKDRPIDLKTVGIVDKPTQEDVRNERNVSAMLAFQPGRSRDV